jgi:hypothetical protein
MYLRYGIPLVSLLINVPKVWHPLVSLLINVRLPEVSHPPSVRVEEVDQVTRHIHQRHRVQDMQVVPNKPPF